MEYGEKRKCIIFGCGSKETEAYDKLDHMYDVLAWADNDTKLQGKRKESIPVVAPKLLREICGRYGDMLDIVVAMDAYKEVVEQLAKLQVPNVLVYRFGFLYRWEKNKLFPVLRQARCFTAAPAGKLRILFAQWRACGRTNKLAAALKKAGCEVYLLYLTAPPSGGDREYRQVYDGIFSAFSPQEALDFVRGSDFDIIHSSNWPDFLTTLLLRGNKPVVHDSHDMASIAYECPPETLALEYITNVQAAGCIYMTEPMRECAMAQYGIPKERTLVLGNLISEDYAPTKKRMKLSSLDNELHCVYEGGVTRTEEHPKHFDELWPKIASCGVHIHFYAPSNKGYCQELEALDPAHIHYEGNLGAKGLADEMGQYDVGLAVYSLREQSKYSLEFSSPNKLSEYVNAGIPVAVGDVDIHREFIEQNGFGKRVTIDGTIRQQLEDIAQIRIPDNVLSDRGYTVESQVSRLIEFYGQCISRYREAGGC